MKVKFFVVATLTVLSLNAPVYASGLEPYSSEKFEQVESAPLVLAFHSASCGTCQRQKPALDTLLKESSMDGVTGLSVDFDSEKVLRKKFKVNSTSTIIVLKNGKEVGRSVGQSSVDSLRKTVAEALAL